MFVGRLNVTGHVFVRSRLNVRRGCGTISPRRRRAVMAQHSGVGSQYAIGRTGECAKLRTSPSNPQGRR